MKIDPPCKEEISQHSRNYQSMPLFNNSDVSDIKCLTDVKRVKEHVEMR